MTASEPRPRKPVVCGLCGYAMPGGTCQRQGCRAARLYWARRKAREQGAAT